jgi:hypothetical protein
MGKGYPLGVDPGALGWGFIVIVSMKAAFAITSAAITSAAALVRTAATAAAATTSAATTSATTTSASIVTTTITTFLCFLDHANYPCIALLYDSVVEDLRGLDVVNGCHPPILPR